MRRGITSEESKLAFAVDKSEVYEALILNRLRRGDPASIRQAVVYAERGKARSLAERLRNVRFDATGQGRVKTARLLARLDRVERELALAESRLPDAAKGSGIRSGAAGRVAGLTAARMRALRSLEREAPELSTLAGGTPLDPLDSVADLAPGEVVLEYVEAGGHFHLFAIERGGIEALPWLVPVDQVRDVADVLRFQLGKGVLGEEHAERFGRFIEPTLRGYFGRLHDMLLGPITDRLDGARVRIVPHGLLHGLPFHAFERDGVPLIDRSFVSYCPSITAMGLLARRQAAGGGRPLVLGVPDRAAPLIEAEVEEIRRRVPRARVFRGDRATSRAMWLSESRPGLLHVACHGFYAEHSAWTGALRLGDSWLSLPEIFSLQGTADLVVLSGCETGRGTVYSGDEWIGLVRGFLQAGARSVVASLWEVQDRSAVSLMGDFYTGLVGGADVTEALTLAQRKARREDPMPLRWAPFMVIGDPSVRLGREEAA